VVFESSRRRFSKARLKSLFENSPEAPREGKRLQVRAETSPFCKPGPLTGRVFKQALRRIHASKNEQTSCKGREGREGKRAFLFPYESLNGESNDRSEKSFSGVPLRPLRCLNHDVPREFFCAHVFLPLSTTEEWGPRRGAIQICRDKHASSPRPSPRPSPPSAWRRGSVWLRLCGAVA